ncbi:hypothetical protein, partial [Pseudomonas viridiflava]|uniref:hypothetical protein n=1 Tax=Pseudomonas viridiflava TaxID=33069 RepID=UPI001980A4A8
GLREAYLANARCWNLPDLALSLRSIISTLWPVSIAVELAIERIRASWVNFFRLRRTMAMA